MNNDFLYLQVRMNFGYKSARPGDNVTVSVSALPGSLCSLSMVDKSVYLHGGSNLLQTSSIMKKLGSYDLTSDFIIDWQYCSATSDLPPILTPVGKSSQTWPGLKVINLPPCSAQLKFVILININMLTFFVSLVKGMFFND